MTFAAVLSLRWAPWHRRRLRLPPPATWRPGAGTSLRIRTGQRPLVTIRAALLAAAGGDVVLVSNGTYVVSQTVAFACCKAAQRERAGCYGHRRGRQRGLRGHVGSGHGAPRIHYYRRAQRPGGRSVRILRSAGARLRHRLERGDGIRRRHLRGRGSDSGLRHRLEHGVELQRRRHLFRRRRIGQQLHDPRQPRRPRRWSLRSWRNAAGLQDLLERGFKRGRWSADGPGRKNGQLRRVCQRVRILRRRGRVQSRRSSSELHACRQLRRVRWRRPVLLRRGHDRELDHLSERHRSRPHKPELPQRRRGNQLHVVLLGAHHPALPTSATTPTSWTS